MVVLKSSQAKGSFLGMGTHVWLEVTSETSQRTTYSGSRLGRLLGVIKNLKKDYDRDALRGELIIPAPVNMTEHEWAEAVINAGESIREHYHKKLFFSWLFPSRKKAGNCCTVAKHIIEKAGGMIPEHHIKGVLFGL